MKFATINDLKILAVTGIDVHYTSWLVVIICIFYTCVGGLKAVVWSDVVRTR
jgi:Na+/proline symporter